MKTARASLPEDVAYTTDSERTQSADRGSQDRKRYGTAPNLREPALQKV